MDSQSYQLVMRSGPTPGKTFELTGKDLTIGPPLLTDSV
jgi:hypothetical protein